MKIALKYPKKKFVEAENIIDLRNQLKKLMIEEFDIKNLSVKPIKDIKVDVKTSNITKEDFKILLSDNNVIIPTIITQCKA